MISRKKAIIIRFDVVLVPMAVLVIVPVGRNGFDATYILEEFPVDNCQLPCLPRFLTESSVASKLLKMLL